MINLEKKQKIDLTKREPGLKLIRAGLGWDEVKLNGKNPDCDVSLFMLGENNKILSEEYFIFYNNLVSPDGSTEHKGDNRTGAGDGDDEMIDINLPQVSSSIVQLLFVVTIDNSSDGFNFGNVKNAQVTIYNRANNNPICQYKLTDQFPDSDSLIIGRLYRNGTEWEFEAMGTPYSGGLQAAVEMYS